MSGRVLAPISKRVRVRVECLRVRGEFEDYTTNTIGWMRVCGVVLVDRKSEVGKERRIGTQISRLKRG